MKESVRNTKSRDELSKNIRDIRKNNGNAWTLFVLCIKNG